MTIDIFRELQLLYNNMYDRDDIDVDEYVELNRSILELIADYNIDEDDDDTPDEDEPPVYYQNLKAVGS